MGDVAYRQDVVNRKRFLDYIIANHRSWLDFADVLGHDVALSDLILVTGCDKTSAWACAAWSEKNKSLKATFFAGAPGIVEGNANIWGRWESAESLDRNVGPQPLVPPSRVTSQQSDDMLIEDPPSSPSPSNQCVFLRGYRMGDRSTWLKRRKIRVDVGTGFMTVRKPLDSKKKDNKDSTTRNASQRSLASSCGESSQSGMSRSGSQSTETCRGTYDDENFDSDDESTSSVADIDEVHNLHLQPCSRPNSDLVVVEYSSGSYNRLYF